MWLQIEWFIMIVNLIITNSLLTINRSNFIYNLSCWIWFTPIKCVAVSIHSITKDSEIPTNRTTQFHIMQIGHFMQISDINLYSKIAFWVSQNSIWLNMNAQWVIYFLIKEHSMQCYMAWLWIKSKPCVTQCQ